MKKISNYIFHFTIQASVCLVCSQFYCADLIAQQVGINILYPDSSAALHVESDSLGFLPPTLTAAQRDQISNPAQGLIIYNETDSTLQFFNGECWIKTYQKNCDDCDFNFSMSPMTGNIDRIFSDTTGTNITINQTSGSPTTIGLFLLHNLPAGVTAVLDSYTITGNGTVHLTVTASIFADPGTYPIAIQAICGGTIQNLIFVVTIDPCIEVDILGSQINYDLQQINSLPGPGTPICVIVRVWPGADLTSSDTLIPAYTSGILDQLSHVGIDLQGSMIAKGGDGGFGGSFTNFGSPGYIGGDAAHLTTKTTLQMGSNAFLLSGGGGGGSVGLGLSIPIPGLPPFGLGIGSGGGGGAALGTGGVSTIAIPFWADGSDATGGPNGQPGDGGVLNVPITIPIVSGISITITPNVIGGDGGAFGNSGQTGNLTIQIVVTLPIIGNIPIPVPPITAFPPGGGPGMAVKRNGNILIGLPDGNYQTNFIRGTVGP